MSCRKQATRATVSPKPVQDQHGGFRQWLSGSKPTEWILVIGGFVSGLYVWNSGYLDNRKIEVDNKSTLAKIETTKLEIEKSKLEAETKQTQDSLIAINGELSQTKEKLSKLFIERDNAKSQLNVFLEQQAAMNAEIENIALLQKKQTKSANYYITIEVERQNSYQVHAIKIAAKSNDTPSYGFASKEAVPFPNRAEVFEVLAKLPALYELSLESVLLTKADLDMIAHLPKVTSLSFINCGLGNHLIANANFSKQVSYVSFAKNLLSVVPGNLPGNLEAIDFSHTNFDDVAVSDVIQNLQVLKAIVLKDTKITPRSIDKLGRSNGDVVIVASEDKIDDLNVGFVGRRTKDYIGAAVRDGKLVMYGKLNFDLIDYDFAGSTITGEGILTIVPNDYVISIDVSRTSITDVGLSHLRKFRKLQSLDLRQTHVSFEGLISFCQDYGKLIVDDKELSISVDAGLKQTLQEGQKIQPPISNMIKFF